MSPMFLEARPDRPLAPIGPRRSSRPSRAGGPTREAGPICAAHDVEASVSAAPPLLPGALRITSALSEVGLAQGIVSASPRRIVEKVASALGDVFAVLVTGDDGVGAKPDPLPYATAIERLDLRPEDCVVVEDSPTRAASARSNGIHVVQIGATKHFPADPGLVVVPDLASITPHLLLWAQR